MAIPGCGETYEEPQWEKGGRPQQPQDRHQKVRYVKQGDLIAIPPGVPYWTYNYGDTPLIIITLLDTSNKLNQLDRIPRVSNINNSYNNLTVKHIYIYQ